MPVRSRKDKKNYHSRVYLPVAIIAAGLLLILFTGLKTAGLMIHTYAPLLETAKEIRLETTTGHLWFEEILSGDESEDIASVRRHLQDGIRYTRVMLDGGEGPGGRELPALENKRLRTLLAGCLASQQKYRRIMEARYDRFINGGAGPGSALDKRFDRMFLDFLQQAQEVEAGLRELIDRKWRNFRRMGGGITLLVVLSGLLAAFLIRSHLRQQERNAQALAASEANIRITFNSIGDAVIVTDSRGCITRMNPVAEELTGWSLSEAGGRPLSEIFRICNAQTGEEVENPVGKVLDSGLIIGLANHTVLVARDGGRYQIADSGAPIRDDHGTITGVVLVFRDVTHEYERERSLEEKEERFRSLFNNMGSGAAVYKAVNNGEDFVFLDLNRSAEKIEGIDSDEVLGRSILDVFPGAEDLGLFDVIRRVWQSGEPEFLPSAVYRDDRIQGWRENYVYRLSNGEVVAVYQDVSERKAMEEELRQSKQFLEKALDSLTHPFYVIDSRDYTVKLANKAAGFDFSQEGITCYRLSHNRSEPCRGREHPCTLDEVRRTGRSAVVEHIHYDGFGEKRYVEIHAHPVFDREGLVSQIIEYIIDITERRKGEEERQRLVTAIEQVEDSIVITDREATILYVNPGFEQITGYSREEAVGENPRILKSGVHDEVFYQEMWQTLLQGGTWRGRLTNRKKNGELFDEEASITPVMDEEGRIRNYVAVKRDITEKVKLEQQLRQTQKMEAIGTLAGGIAHDFNNILTAILGFSGLARDKAGPDEDVRQDLDKVLEAGNRARELIKQILTFSRDTDRDLQPLRIQYILKEALKMLRSTIPATIEIREEIDTACGPVLADPTQIYQVVMNLCTNAYQAMHNQGGTLGVTLSRSALEADDLSDKWDLEPGKYVIMEISDTGPGIPEYLQERIFEPYFTTKEKEEGTGMGLSVVHGIVTSHGGHISVYSGPEQGATFRVYLPRYKDEQEALPEEPEPSKEPASGNENILVVDDEEDVAGLNRKMLASLGYKVTALTSSREALETFRRSPRSFDLIITDMTMPELTGTRLSQEILAVRPDIPIIICTGYSELINREKAREIGIKEYLMKPVSKKKLAATVRQCLDGN